jgi:hypothetical protein
MAQYPICTACGTPVANKDAHAGFHRKLVFKAEPPEKVGRCAGQARTYARGGQNKFRRIVCNIEHEHTMHQGVLDGLIHSWFDPAGI